MPTIGEVYDPIVEAAQNNDNNGFKLLSEAGQAIFKNNPERCPNIADGVNAARNNLDYYCQYFDERTMKQTKQFYGLGTGFRDLSGNKY